MLRAPRPRLVELIHLCLAGTVVAVLYTNVHRYLFVAGLYPVHPDVVLIGSILVCSMLAAERRAFARVATSPVLWWAVAYVVVAGFGYFFGSLSLVSLGAVGRAWIGAAAIVSFLLLFSSPRTVRVTRVGVALAVVLAVFLNLIDVARPETFSVIFGRAAGMYLNPNIAGSAIVMGFVVALTAVRRPWRLAFAALSGLGVLATLSRSGLLCWVVACVVFWGYREISRSGALASVAVLAVGLLALAQRPGFVSEALFLGSELLGGKLSRLGFGSEVLSSTSILARQETIRASLDMFEANPLFGAGTGATREWALTEGTHNLYLRFLAEHGLGGLLLYLTLPLLIWSYGKTEPSTRSAFAAVWLLYGLFNHNDLETPHSLIALALVVSAGRGIRESHVA